MNKSSLFYYGQIVQSESIIKKLFSRKSKPEDFLKEGSRFKGGTNDPPTTNPPAKPPVGQKNV